MSEEGNEMGKLNSSGIYYTVRSGDTLYSISRRYNATVAEICRENEDLDIYHLQPGDEILIPISFQVHKRVVEYTVKKNETLQSILNRFQIELDELLKYNDLESLKLSQGMLLHIPSNELEMKESV